MSEIFISHVEEDEGIALDIARELEAAGYHTWYYERDADPGPSYLLQVQHAIERCSAIVIVITPAAVRSHQMTVEVVRGHESGKAFLPVRSGISHAEFQESQQEWRMALGAAASLAIPPEGAVAVVPRLIRGLQGLGIEPTTGPPVVDRRGREEEQRRRDARLAPGAARRTPFDLVHRWTKSKLRVALAVVGGALLVFFTIVVLIQKPAPPAPPVPGPAPPNVQTPPRTSWAEVPYRNVDVIGRMPTVVQVFDPT